MLFAYRTSGATLLFLFLSHSSVTKMARRTQSAPSRQGGKTTRAHAAPTPHHNTRSAARAAPTGATTAGPTTGATPTRGRTMARAEAPTPSGGPAARGGRTVTPAPARATSHHGGATPPADPRRAKCAQLKVRIAAAAPEGGLLSAAMPPSWFPPGVPLTAPASEVARALPDDEVHLEEVLSVLEKVKRGPRKEATPDPMAIGTERVAHLVAMMSGGVPRAKVMAMAPVAGVTLPHKTSQWAPLLGRLSAKAWGELEAMGAVLLAGVEEAAPPDVPPVSGEKRARGRRDDDGGRRGTRREPSPGSSDEGGAAAAHGAGRDQRRGAARGGAGDKSPVPRAPTRPAAGADGMDEEGDSGDEYEEYEEDDTSAATGAPAPAARGEAVTVQDDDDVGTARRPLPPTSAAAAAAAASTPPGTWAGFGGEGVAEEVTALNEARVGGTGLFRASNPVGWSGTGLPPAQAELVRRLRTAVRGLPLPHPLLLSTPRAWASAASAAGPVPESLEQWLRQCTDAGVHAVDGATASQPLAYLLERAMGCAVTVSDGIVTVTAPSALDTRSLDQWLTFPSRLRASPPWEDYYDHMATASSALRGAAGVDTRACDFTDSCGVLFLRAWLTQLYHVAPAGTAEEDILRYMWWSTWAAVVTGLFIWKPTREVTDALRALVEQRRGAGLPQLPPPSTSVTAAPTARGTPPWRGSAAAPVGKQARPCTRCGAPWKPGHLRECPAGRADGVAAGGGGGGGAARARDPPPPPLPPSSYFPPVPPVAT